MRIKIGDVEKNIDDTIYIRLWYDAKQMEEINKKYSSHLHEDEWITLVVTEKGVEKAVAYSEEDNFEYNVADIIDYETLLYDVCEFCNNELYERKVR